MCLIPNETEQPHIKNAHNADCTLFLATQTDRDSIKGHEKHKWIQFKDVLPLIN